MVALGGQSQRTDGFDFNELILAERVGFLSSGFRLFADFYRWLLIHSVAATWPSNHLAGVFRCLRPVADFSGAMELEMEL